MRLLPPAALLAMLFLAGCIGQASYRMGPVAEMIPPQPDRCGLAQMPAMAGKPMATLADFPLGDRLRVRWSVHEVTDDIRPVRLHAEVDVQGRIRRLFCG